MEIILKITDNFIFFSLSSSLSLTRVNLHYRWGLQPAWLRNIYSWYITQTFPFTIGTLILYIRSLSRYCWKANIQIYYMLDTGVWSEDKQWLAHQHGRREVMWKRSIPTFTRTWKAEKLDCLVFLNEYGQEKNTDTKLTKVESIVLSFWTCRI